MPSAAIDIARPHPPEAAEAPERLPELALFAGAAGRLVLAGHPRPAQRTEGLVQRPKEVLLALTAALAEAEGLQVLRANPHFTPVADWDGAMAVAHFCPLDLTCPLPLARNALLLDGEDLLALAEERRVEAEFGLQRRRVLLMDAVLSAAAPGAAGDLLPDGVVVPAPVGALLARGGPLLAAQAVRRSGAPQPGQPGPVQWMSCDLETGNYNFLELKRHPRLGTSHARVLLDPGLRGGQSALIGFATPTTLPDLAPALRAFAALRGGAAAEVGPQFFIFFFGGPEEFAAALAARPDALFFGDNFRCPAIRFLFAPFAVPDLLEAIRGASAVVDSCYGGMLEGLAQGLGVARRVVLGPGGSIEAAEGDRYLARGIDWAGVLQPATLARRRQKANRAGERMLADILEAML